MDESFRENIIAVSPRFDVVSLSPDISPWNVNWLVSKSCLLTVIISTPKVVPRVALRVEYTNSIAPSAFESKPPTVTSPRCSVGLPVRMVSTADAKPSADPRYKLI